MSNVQLPSRDPTRDPLPEERLPRQILGLASYSQRQRGSLVLLIS